MRQVDAHVVDQEVSAGGRSIDVLRQRQLMSKSLIKVGHHAGII